MSSDDPVCVGSSVWRSDPNDPEIHLDSIVGGLVMEIESGFDRHGEPSEIYHCARNFHGKIVYSHVFSDQVVVHQEHVDRALASNVYRALAKEVGTQRRASDRDLRKLHQAVAACQIWSAR